jgi:hypothetical protein
MTNDLSEVFRRAHWNVTATVDVTLRPDLGGINIVYAPESLQRSDKDLPMYGAQFSRILDEANIKFGWGIENRFDNNSLLIAIGSRPPTWP